jgi:Fic family protein
MKMPEKPPSFPKLEKPERLISILSQITSPVHEGKYIHWDKLRHLQPPDGFSSEEWWFGLKFQRSSLYKKIPLNDTQGKPFRYGLSDPVPELLHLIDHGAGGLIGLEDQIINPSTRDRYVISSLIEESIRSSQLEGAVTTRQIAKDMIRTGRAPRDRSEQMIYNNFITMQRIREVKNQYLTPELIFELHRMITDKTLDNPMASGRVRNSDEKVRVEDIYGEVFHLPPEANQLEKRLGEMCDFANGKTPEGFIHPVIRAIVLHFWLAYDHPFLDGNGRCARALFYWLMLHQGYWLTEYIAISQIIHKAPIKYYRAFLYTETDDNDLTYFVLYHLQLIWKAIQELHKYIERKTEEIRDVERQLKSMVHLNYRQQAILGHALRHPDAQYSIGSHGSSHKIVYQTARTDLMDLKKKGLLISRKIGRTWYFSPADNLNKRLSTLE